MLKRYLKVQKGFSLIESVLAIVIIGGALIGLSQMLTETTMDNIDIDISTVGVFLAHETMVETMAQDFGNINDVLTTPYTGNFANHSYQVAVDYVNDSNLDSPVGGPTDYKRVVVTVTSSVWPGSITLTSLAVNL